MQSHRLTLIGHLIVYALLLLCAVAFIAPFAWMLSTSLKPLNETMVLPPVWIPSEIQWHNYRDALVAMGDFWRYAGNTIMLCFLSVIGTVLSSALTAYGFSRIEWKGRDAVFVLCLATMMIPFPVIMVPVYTLFREIGWVGTFKPLWVPAFLGSAFNIFLLRQFFMTIPKDLTEAARIDGCGELRIFFQIILPIARPALLVVALFTFMYTWNDFLVPSST
ncbi:MAG: carbohydrate ABC transporter permease [Opitutaceae bacterium]